MENKEMTLKKMMLKNARKTSLACLAFVAMASFGSAHADALTDIKARGELTCGVLGNSQPFSFVSKTQSRELVGYDIDMCRSIAKGLGVKSTLRQITNDARIPELSQGRVDILVAALSWTSPRAEQIDFTRQYFTGRLLILTRKGGDIKTLKDMDGKRVSVVKGTTSETALAQDHPQVKVISYPDAPTGFLAFRQGKTDAYSISELLMKRFLMDVGAESASFEILDQPLRTEAWGLGIRKGEAALLAATNQVMERMEASGEAKEIFDRWFNKETGYPLDRTFKFDLISSK